MLIGITTYNRPDMLLKLVNELQGHDIVIVNDGGELPDELPIENVYTLPHLGKQGYYIIYQALINKLLNSKHDDFLILPDDASHVNIERVKELHERFRNSPFFVNVINDGRKSCWSLPKFKAPVHYDLINTGFFDCGGVTNRAALSLLDRFVVPKEWFKRLNMSSGVGCNITNQMNEKRVPMYTAKVSLVYHGDHTSQMHPEERIKTPLISK